MKVRNKSVVILVILTILIGGFVLSQKTTIKIEDKYPGYTNVFVGEIVKEVGHQDVPYQDDVEVRITKNEKGSLNGNVIVRRIGFVSSLIPKEYHRFYTTHDLKEDIYIATSSEHILPAVESTSQ